ncbi:TonB-dependent receptor [Glaciecola sp. 1036]|uniref:TonB-dependent receptor n=1 Tax=Alteromonadaceae TaxID=72275 RepID=UPI003CFE66BF
MQSTQQHKNGALFKRTKTSLSILAALGIMLPNLALAQEQEAEPENTEDTEVIEVKGLRSSIISAQMVKMNSNKIMDGISADDIGALPDRSVTETLQRVAGVAIDRYMSQGDPEHFSVEGNGVIVRGLTQVRSELNGRSTFSANGGRTLSFGDVPPELLAAVNVYKSPTADQIEGGLAGTIDLETRLPFHASEREFAFNISANYGDKVKDTTPAYSFLYSDTWDTDIGKIGFLADIAYSELSTRNDSMYVRPFFARDDIAGQEGNTVYIPRGADWRSMNFNRERTGQYAAVQWEPAENHELTLTYFNSRYEMMWDEDAIFVSNDITALQATEDSTYDANGAMLTGRVTQDSGIVMGSDIRVSREDSETNDIALEYEYTGEAFNFSIQAQRVKATTEKLDSTVAVAVRVPYIDIDLSGSLPAITSDAAVLGDVDSYRWDFLMDNQVDNEAEMTSLQVDFDYFLDNDVFHTVHFGARFSDSNSDNFDSGYNWGAIGNWLIDAGAVVSGANPSASDVNINEFNDFFSGDVPRPANIYAPLRYYAEGFPESYDEVKSRIEYVDWAEGAAWQPRDLTDDQWYNNQEEKTQSAYVMFDYSFNDLKYPVSGNVGVRYVKTENTAIGSVIFPANLLFGDGGFFPFEAEHSYSNVLPSMNMKIELTDDLLLRLAAAKAMARPDYSRLQSRLEFSADIREDRRDALLDDQGNPLPGVTITAADFNLGASANTNPYLDPIESTQLDLSLEWYYAPGSSAYIALFNKDIKGYEVEEFVTETYDAPGPDGTRPLDFNFQRPVSTGEADIRGFELSVNHFFTDLPAPFDGFGIQANYTYIDSKTDVKPEGDPVDTDGSSYGVQPYRGLSKNAYNLVGIYQKNDWTVRLAYNWRSEFLTSIGANGFNGTTPISPEGYVRPSGVGTDNFWRLPVLNDAAGYLDGSVSYQVNENFTVILEANNLSNTITKNIMRQNGAGDHNSAYHQNDTRFALSLRGKF